ncbi:InlB B-repeat-containing protein, partial [Candidatus Saccharibacteria bacterium]|nr:InlB B-repeat-containing protein [Candidatus Saccharibacteria bacterium]
AVGAKDSTGTVIDSPGEGTGSYCDSLSYPLNQSGCNPSSYRTYNINVGAKLTSSLPAGTYTNDIVFSATTKSEGTKYTMNFNSNGGNNGNIINPRIVIAGLSTILPTSGFTKDGMGIKGWAFKSGVTPSTANTSADTTMYNAGQSVAINDLLASAISAGQNPSTNNSFTVYAVWETAYTINFNKNSNEAIGSMNPDTPIIQSATYTIPTATFTREDYNFIGWALSASDAESGTVAYTAGQTPTVSSLITAAQAAGQTVTPGAAGTITLYVVWELARDTRTLADITYMQDINSDIIENTANGATASLRDSRDNQYYTVYKIPTNTVYAGTSTVANIAGKLIMTKDLNLGAVNSVSGASSSITAQGTMNLSPQDSAFSTPTGSGESITVPTTTTAVTHGTPGTGDNYYTNRQYRIDGTGNYAGRGYYTWGAAMLACPKNWRLPTSDEYTNSDSWEGQTAGLAAIVKGANASTTISNITSSPWSFVLGGYYSIGFNNAGSRGYYWSTTQGGSTSSYHLYMDSSSGLLRNNYDKRIGFAVRCVAD